MECNTGQVVDRSYRPLRRACRQIPLRCPTEQAANSAVECRPSLTQMRLRYSLTVVWVTDIKAAISLLPLPWPINASTSCSLAVKSEILVPEHLNAQAGIGGWRPFSENSGVERRGRSGDCTVGGILSHSRTSEIENRHCLPTLTAGILWCSAQRHSVRQDIPSQLDSSLAVSRGATDMLSRQG